MVGQCRRDRMLAGECSAKILTNDYIILLRDPEHHPEGSATLKASNLTHLFDVHFSFLSCTVSYLDVYLGVPILPHLTLINQSVLSRRYIQDVMLHMNKKVLSLT